MSSYSVPDLSSPPPPTLCKQTPNHPSLLRSRCPNHLNLPRLTTSATQLDDHWRLYKCLTALSVFQGHPTHPSHHHTLCPFQTSQVISLHCPRFSSIYQDTLDTSTIDPSFDTIRCTTHSQNRRKLLEDLAQAHLNPRRNSTSNWFTPFYLNHCITLECFCG